MEDATPRLTIALIILQLVFVLNVPMASTLMPKITVPYSPTFVQMPILMEIASIAFLGIPWSDLHALFSFQTAANTTQTLDHAQTAVRVSTFHRTTHV